MPARTWSKRIAALLASGLIGSCAAPLERARVSRRFSTIFGCQHPDVHRVAGGYVAEGCGAVAHFTCFDSDDDDDMLFKPGSAGGLISALVGGARGRDTCVLEHSARAAPSANLPVPVRRTSSQGAVAVKTRVLFAGGQLAALGKPALHPLHALLTVRTVRRLDPAPCSVELFHDGVRLPIEETEQTGNHEVRLLVPVAGLAGVGRSVRFAGEVCGAEFELDQASREALGRFHARFSEERQRGELTLASGDERE